MCLRLPGLCLLLAALPLAAVEPAFFQTRNQGPLAVLYGVPTPGALGVLAPGRSEGSVRLDWSNSYALDSNGGDDLELDGETLRATLAWRRGLAPGLEVGLELPVSGSGGGVMDGFIEGYHRVFGLPGKDRALRPQRAYRVRYAKGGQALLDRSQGSTGLGDLCLNAGWQVSGLTLRGSLKLPTGDPDRLLGSGSTDLALWLVGGAASGRWAFAWSGGLLAMSRGELLPEQQRRLAGFGSLALGWAASSRLALRAQLDGQTPLYGDSELRELRLPAVQLTLGGSWTLGHQRVLDLGLSEDLVVNTSPDVVVHAAYRQGF
nr:DUF3187 family protein [uncultured Holophaga sp.]